MGGEERKEKREMRLKKGSGGVRVSGGRVWELYFIVWLRGNGQQRENESEAERGCECDAYIQTPYTPINAGVECE